MGALYFLMFTFQRDGSHVLEKDSLGLQNWQEIDLHLKENLCFLRGFLTEK